MYTPPPFKPDRTASLAFAEARGFGTVCVYDGGKPVFLLNGQTYELASERGYRNFWAIYHRPPEQKHRHYLLERRDSLLPVDEQKFKGAYYTPLHIVDKAYDYLTATLGENWQQRYIVWDMCCGVGNLEVKHSNYRNVFMSTLDRADIEIMQASHTCVGATIFQYDYLNDDVTDFGEIDYSLSNKLPAELRQAIADAKAGKKGAKQLLVLINPPYAETGAGVGQGDKNKIGCREYPRSNLNAGHGYRLCQQGVVRPILDPHSRGSAEGDHCDVQHAQICQCAQLRKIQN